MEVYIANPRGFCVGVANAVKLAVQVREENPTDKIAILGMLVHNEDVAKTMLDLKIDTIDDPKKTLEESLLEIPQDTIVIFTAHGHSEKLEQIAKDRNIRFYDATCERVKDNLSLIKKEIGEGHQVIYIGKKNHPETNAAISISNKVVLYEVNKVFDEYSEIEDESPLVVNQTTLSTTALDEIHKTIQKFIPNARICNEICSATSLRQKAAKNISDDYDLIYVVGSKNSSNSTELFEIAKSSHPYSKVLLILNKNDVKNRDLEDAEKVAICSSASTPIDTINNLYEFIRYFK